ncbi:hypothetical protein WN944_015526 [Citrus x changshan-huyou]|uniref:TIR domain-containing protein n=1 Tax=Citrus x changshan-huyou TaxID=2935761 RepID=A0AAP0QMN7_9ROSI
MMFLGDEISGSLVNAIKASALSVIIFSEDYASSGWCLDELVEILECKKEYAQIVIPVFYRVDPSDVRNQTGSFGISFSKLEERFKENSEKLQTWRKGLREAAGVESNDVYALGIWGIGGIGKTTIARATFDKISSDFEVSRIIITTRNKQVLRNWGVSKIYEMEALEYHHALELFNRHAFKQNHPDVGYDELSSKVMKYAQGVPLALKVLGCFLYKREKEVWESAIDKLQRILHPSILEVSYLQDLGFAEVKYLHWHGYPLKSLPSNLSAEKLVFLEVPNSDIEQLWNGVKHYSKLNQLIHAACKKLIAKNPNPTLIHHLNKLVILNLRGSKSLKSIPAGIFNLEFLTELDLSGCSKLKRLPEISSGNIGQLFLSGTAIEELPSSFELLLRLWLLDLSDCKRLKSLPSSLFVAIAATLNHFCHASEAKY